MHIVVVDVPADRGGALSILNDFYNFVKDHGQRDQWTFIVSTPELEACDHIQVVRLPWIRKSLLHRLGWDYCLAGRRIKKYRPDVIFSLQNIPIPFSQVPNIVYVHQSLPFQNVKRYSFFDRRERSMAFYQHVIGRLIKAGVRRANQVIVQSSWMKLAMIDQTQIQENKVAVIPPELIMPEIDRCSLKTGYPIQMNRFFYPAGASHYKNHHCILQAARILLDRGYKDFTIEFTMNKDDNSLARELYTDAQQLEDCIRFIGPLARSDVYKKFAESVLLFPSYIETVGLPLIEARMIGGVILASNCNFSQENLAGYENARFFDPMDPLALTQEMEFIMQGGWSYSLPSGTPSRVNSGWQPVLNLIKECVVPT
ncbi:glycosyltransferase [Paenibacillus terrigena]|uniref:glycosyltransferase n=1 Tax=Paenibacillus terrigena TaxID=369333 RepID=UPI00037DA8E0|nr:glycosyltransferase [Paenibacillus terrigena]